VLRRLDHVPASSARRDREHRAGYGAQTRHVDDVPRALRPAFLLGSHGLALLLRFYVLVVRWSSRIEYVGTERLSDENHIFGVWHQLFWPNLLALPSHPPQVWLAHPHWYMKPIHLLVLSLGVRGLILGSTGNSGRQAADRLVEHLRAGASTCVAPEGPAGPAREPKKGILHLSSQSGAAIIPVRIHCSLSITLPGWDRKIVPLPFGRILVHYGTPIRVRVGGFSEAMAAFTASLE
jgi:lysophospholipid acyltransferase (LPLAT)-like uncharacterized protein